ncbi:pentatricopeptide repeat-containing protein At5g47360 [Silene latifolia]|uniref:pentatricopeptide repeat-containing protein At5g47360 n=1 Tax=Silene latifolia TaxID=37657 RepID=UPI003D7772E5
MKNMAISLFNHVKFRLTSPKFSHITRINLTSIAEKYCTHLLNHPQNPEKTLIQFDNKLDAKCVTEVLKRLSFDNPKMGLRFFIWSGIQSNYRHSKYMYGMACNVLEIRRNPGFIREVVEGYRVEGCVTNLKLFKVMLNLCKESRVCDEALWVLRKMEDFNCRPDSTVYNLVIGLFCEKGELDVAFGLMREMESRNLCPDMITYMSLLKGFCGVGRLDAACLLFKAMRGHGCTPNLVAYSALLDGLCRFGDFERALELLAEMEKEGGECAPSVITYTSVIQCLCENGKSSEALSVLDRMGSSKCSPNRITVSVLVKGLCAEGSIDEAYKLVGRIVAEDHVAVGECYSSLVTGLLNTKRLEDAEKLFRWMLNNDLRPDGLACSILLKTMCGEGRFLDVFHLLEDVEKKGFVVTIDSDIYSVLLVGLCQGRNVSEVVKLSSLMIEKRIQVKDCYVKDIEKYISGMREMQSLAQLREMKGEC